MKWMIASVGANNLQSSRKQELPYSPLKYQETLSCFGSTLTLSLMTDDLPTSKLQYQRVSMLLLIQSPWTLYFNNSGIVSALYASIELLLYRVRMWCHGKETWWARFVCGPVRNRSGTRDDSIHSHSEHSLNKKVGLWKVLTCRVLDFSNQGMTFRIWSKSVKTRNSSIRMALLILFRVTQNQRYCSIVHYLELRRIYI